MRTDVSRTTRVGSGEGFSCWEDSVDAGLTRSSSLMSFVSSLALSSFVTESPLSWLSRYVVLSHFGSYEVRQLGFPSKLFVNVRCGKRRDFRFSGESNRVWSVSTTACDTHGKLCLLVEEWACVTTVHDAVLSVRFRHSLGPGRACCICN
jgi:hypothetical protein